jgi:hypothetical protein
MWKSTTLNSNGSYTYDVYQQHDINNCGPSSITMAVKQGLGKSVSIGFAQMLVGQIEVGAGRRTAAAGDARWHDWGEGPEGGYSYLGDLCAAIKKQWPDLNPTMDKGGATHGAKLGACTPNKPALAHVGWDGGGGHFIVCLGKQANGRMLWLDPYFGVVECGYRYSNTKKAVRYRTAHNSFGRSADKAWSSLAIYMDPA